MSEKLKSTMIRYLIYNKKGEYASSWPIKRTSARTPNFFGTHYSFKHWLNSRYLQYFHIFLTVSASLDVWTLLEKIDYKVQVWSFYALRKSFSLFSLFQYCLWKQPSAWKIEGVCSAWTPLHILSFNNAADTVVPQRSSRSILIYKFWRAIVGIN